MPCAGAPGYGLRHSLCESLSVTQIASMLYFIVNAEFIAHTNMFNITLYKRELIKLKDDLLSNYVV